MFVFTWVIVDGSSGGGGCDGGDGGNEYGGGSDHDVDGLIEIF